MIAAVTLMQETSWWRTLLDGAVGEACGGLVTVGVLFAGFAFERARDDERDIVAECRRLISVVRTTFHPDLKGNVPPPVDAEERSLRTWRRVLDVLPWKADMDALASRLERREPCTAVLIRSAAHATQWWYTTGKLVTDPDGQQRVDRITQEAICATDNAVALLAKRVNDRPFFKRLSRERCDELEAKVRVSTEFLTEKDWSSV